jgi:hypothetical protein
MKGIKSGHAGAPRTHIAGKARWRCDTDSGTLVGIRRSSHVTFSFTSSLVRM